MGRTSPERVPQPDRPVAPVGREVGHIGGRGVRDGLERAIAAGCHVVDERTPLRRLIAKEELDRFLGSRNARTRHILVLRGRGWTLSRIGQVFGLTRERVRQVIAEAVRVGAGARPPREGSRS